MRDTYIGIRTARGGFIIEYSEDNKPAEGAETITNHVTEIIATESKLIKRLREILATHGGESEQVLLG